MSVVLPTPVSAERVREPLGFWGRLFRHKPLGAAGAVVLAVFLFLGVFADLIAPHGFNEIAPLERMQAPSAAHWFGTDNVGRDLFARTLEGGRVSLLVGLLATLVSVVIGVAWGAIAGYFGGRLDAWMMRAVDVLYALPFMFLVILLMVVFGRNIFLIFVAIGAINWLDMARIVRGQTISIRRREFIEAAEASGVSKWRIITRHIIPNCLGPVVVYVTLTVPSVILTESFISFLGMGVQEPDSSWGTLISEAAVVMEIAPWAITGTGAMLAITLMSLNFIGDGLRDALDPKDR